jgi:hypothetical protein
MNDSRDDASMRLHAQHRNVLDLWAVWPDGTECALAEPRDLASLLTWMSDDYEIKAAIGYDETSSPIFGTTQGEST